MIFQRNIFVIFSVVIQFDSIFFLQSKKYRDTKQSNKRNNQNSKSKRQDNHM